MRRPLYIGTGACGGNMIKVLIVEDSAVIAGHLKGLLESDPEIRILAIAKNGIEAVAMARNLRPDVITMDILMPKMDGVKATRLIMREAPTRIIVVTASADRVESRPAFEAIKEGALTVLEKPRGYGHHDYDLIKANLIKTVKVMSTVKVVTRWGRRSRPTLTSAGFSAEPRIIAIGASTGGPAALSLVLKAFPRLLPVPVVIVQHMTAGFGSAFAGWLGQECALPIKIAEAGELIKPGVVYIAPDDLHLGVSAGGHVELTTSYAKKTYHRPSINYFFETVARNYQGHSIGVLLTGMGEDGATGLQDIKEAGGKTCCQDEATSIVFGMPKAAITLGAADIVLPIDKIGPALVDTVSAEPAKHGEKVNV